MFANKPLLVLSEFSDSAAETRNKMLMDEADNL
jgi:hypothetical protein